MVALNIWLQNANAIECDVWYCNNCFNVPSWKAFEYVVFASLSIAVKVYKRNYENFSKHSLFSKPVKWFDVQSKCWSRGSDSWRLRVVRTELWHACSFQKYNVDQWQNAGRIIYNIYWNIHAAIDQLTPPSRSGAKCQEISQLFFFHFSCFHSTESR